MHFYAKFFSYFSKKSPRRLSSPGDIVLICYFTFTSLTAIYGLDGMSIVNSPL